MSNIVINWMGHCTKDGSDKLWGVCEEQKNFYTFWCRRGNTVKVKYNGSDPADLWLIRRLVNSKEDKGYCNVSQYRYDELHPGLLDQLERAIVLDKLRR